MADGHTLDLTPLPQVACGRWMDAARRHLSGRLLPITEIPVTKDRS
jgi:hypothetical protein